MKDVDCGDDFFVVSVKTRKQNDKKNSKKLETRNESKLSHDLKDWQDHIYSSLNTQSDNNNNKNNLNPFISRRRMFLNKTQSSGLSEGLNLLSRLDSLDKNQQIYIFFYSVILGIGSKSHKHRIGIPLSTLGSQLEGYLYSELRQAINKNKIILYLLQFE